MGWRGCEIVIPSLPNINFVKSRIPRMKWYPASSVRQFQKVDQTLKPGQVAESWRTRRVKVIERSADQFRSHAFDLACRIAGVERLALFLDRLGGRGQPRQERVEIGKCPALRAQRMQLARDLGAGLVAHCL